jgi:transposase
MRSVQKPQQNQNHFSNLSKSQLLELLADGRAKNGQIESQYQQVQSRFTEQSERLKLVEKEVDEQQECLRKRDNRILLLEELLRLRKIQKFAASSEKMSFQVSLFDEAELESTIEDLMDQAADEIDDETDTHKPAEKKTRKRGFSASLERVRIELALSDEEKAGAESSFFTKVKEELEYIPAVLRVLEYWQEKAVFAQDDGSENIIAAKRPVHPLGKCSVTTSLLAQIITAKYADGLPLYRQEGILKRYGGEISRTNMANWVIRLDDVFKPLLNLISEEQNNGDYLQADETRIQVLKETGKSAQSDKWMWVIRGGPPDKPAVMFHYDPSRSGQVPVRLLDDFNGVLQADGYSGYAQVCKANRITRIGCWDHARRKFVEASKAAEVKKAKGPPAKADVALGRIRKLYALESRIADQEPGQKRRARQEIAIPMLNDLKAWLEKNIARMLKGGLTYKAMQYTLNQWDTLVGYCEDGRLNISNALAENAIRPFAVGRKAWLFSDTPQGAHASATCYSLIESAKANQLEPYGYIKYLLDYIGTADTLEKLEALLPWQVSMEAFSKKVNVFDGGNRRI